MNNNNPSGPLYKVVFSNKDRVCEVFAREVYQSELAGFIELENLVFEQAGSIVVDPEAEKLRLEFAGVSRIFVPFHSIVRIDEVENTKESQIKTSNLERVAWFPENKSSPPKK